ncbi:hypothetical protein FGO68_gene8581 [Halteria grandinella]|uniref:Uncharacterized protein n=1 Tax=Halteria grandinella TaxID=5974 RepID=A0A8J8NHU2_HALGN|nr:hypothetical protein FGO68_gene8581 [Halteria grandinella]
MEHTYLKHPFPDQQTSAPQNSQFMNLNLSLLENSEQISTNFNSTKMVQNFYRHPQYNGSVPVNHTFGAISNPVVQFGTGADGRHSRLLSPRSQMLDNIVSILSHKSIKNKKEYLQRYAFNKEDSTECKSFQNTMNKLIKSKVTLSNSPSNAMQQQSRLNLTMKHDKSLREGASLMRGISAGRNIPRAQSVSVKRRQQYQQFVAQRAQSQLSYAEEQNSHHRQSSTMKNPLGGTNSLFKFPHHQPHLRQPPNQLAFMLSTQKKQIFEMNSKKQMVKQVVKGDLRNYSPEDFVKNRRDQDARQKEALKIPSNLQKDYHRRATKGYEDASHNSSQLGLPSEMTEKQYMYRHQPIHDSTRQITQPPSPLNQFTQQDFTRQYKVATPAINRQAEVEKHKEELLVIKKTSIRVVKPTYTGKGNYTPQNGRRKSAASSQKSINQASKFTEGDLDAVMGQYQIKERKQDDFPPLNKSIDDQTTPQRKTTLTPSPNQKRHYEDEDYLLSRLPSFGGKQQSPLRGMKQNIESWNHVTKGQDSGTQTPTNKDEDGHPSQILQNARFQLNQMNENPSLIEENLRNNLLSEEITQFEGTTPPEAFNQEDPPNLIDEIGIDSIAQQESLSKPHNNSSSHNGGGENTPSFNHRKSNASRRLLQSANSNQFMLNPTYYYSNKNRSNAPGRGVTPPLKGVGIKGSGLNEDIKIASGYPMRKNVGLKQAQVKIVRGRLQTAGNARTPQVDKAEKSELELKGAENLKIDVFTHEYRDSTAIVDELDTAGKSDVMLQQELAMMNDEALLQALKPNDKNAIQKVGSVCKFSSTKAFQEKLKRARTLPRKDFVIPDMNEVMRSGSPPPGRNEPFSPESSPSLGLTIDGQRKEYTHHMLSNKVSASSSNAYKRQQFKRNIMLKEKEQLKQLQAALKPSTETLKKRHLRPESPSQNIPVTAYFLSLDEQFPQQAMTPEFDQYVSKVHVFMQQSRPQSGVVVNSHQSKSKQRIMSASATSNVSQGNKVKYIVSEANLGDLRVISNL